MVSFAEVAGSLDQIMGVKAVWGRSREPVMCFGSRGDPLTKDKGHFQQARATARKALAQPYLVTIGGGEFVPPELDGRVLELVRVTGVYGETTAFVRDTALLERLQQWPVAVVLSEVYAIEGEPLLIDDLGFPDRMILANAYDGVRRDDVQMQKLWDALQGLPVHRRWDVPRLAGFRDPQREELKGSMYPTLTTTSSEGKRVYKLSLEAERSRGLAQAVKARNRAANGGTLVCEACGFTDEQSQMFDAHHLDPLATGIRESRVDDFAVLCPTCHRWAHHKAPDLLEPLSIAELRTVRGNHMADPSPGFLKV